MKKKVAELIQALINIMNAVLGIYRSVHFKKSCFYFYLGIFAAFYVNTTSLKIRSPSFIFLGTQGRPNNPEFPFLTLTIPLTINATLGISQATPRYVWCVLN